MEKVKNHITISTKQCGKEDHLRCSCSQQSSKIITFVMKKTIITIFIAILYFTPLTANAQESKQEHDSLQTNTKTLYKAAAYTSAYYAVSLYVLSETWYKDRRRVPFHFYDDIKGFLQVDKFGHMFGSYFYSYVGYHYLLNSGLTRDEALYFGATLGAILQFPIEIMDGLYEGYGFSWGDVAANIMGSALVLGQELLFNEQVVKYKFSYWESNYSRKANGYLGKTTLDRLFKDYNGHTYWLSAPISKLLYDKSLPPWLNIAVGYGANGMYGEFKNISSYNGVDISETMRYRQYLLSLDIDWTRIKTNSKFLKILLQAMTFIKLPFPALEYNSKGQFKWYWLYY
jgi:uncharacterized protein YfiM (DUF2279 family)